MNQKVLESVLIPENRDELIPIDRSIEPRRGDSIDSRERVSERAKKKIEVQAKRPLDTSWTFLDVGD